MEDSPSDLRVLEDEAKIQDAAAANRSLERSTDRYMGGLEACLTVIGAQSAALDNEHTAVRLLTPRITSAVLLAKALSGGWDVPKLPPGDQKPVSNLLRGPIAQCLQAISCLRHFGRQLQGSGVSALSSPEVAAGFEGAPEPKKRARGGRNFSGM
jgi:hypothetical protein